MSLQSSLGSVQVDSSEGRWEVRRPSVAVFPVMCIRSKPPLFLRSALSEKCALVIFRPSGSDGLRGRAHMPEERASS